MKELIGWIYNLFDFFYLVMILYFFQFISYVLSWLIVRVRIQNSWKFVLENYLYLRDNMLMTARHLVQCITIQKRNINGALMMSILGILSDYFLFLVVSWHAPEFHGSGWIILTIFWRVIQYHLGKQGLRCSIKHKK